MRRSEKQIADLQEIEAIIARASILYLALADRGEPYVVPVNFGYAHGFFYVHGADEGRKIKILGRNSQVCIALHARTEIKPAAVPCAFGMNYESVVGSGRAEIVTDLTEKIDGLRSIFRQAGVNFALPANFSAKHLAKTLVLRIKPQTLTGKRSGDDPALQQQ